MATSSRISGITNYSSRFFERIGKQLQTIGAITAREEELMARSLYLADVDAPNLASEYAKATYLGACLEIGRLKAQSGLDDFARRGGRWWDALLPESAPERQ